MKQLLQLQTFVVSIRVCLIATFVLVCRLSVCLSVISCTVFVA